MAARRAVIHYEEKARIYAAFNRGEDYLHLTEQMGFKRQTAYCKKSRSAEGRVFNVEVNDRQELLMTK